MEKTKLGIPVALLAVLLCLLGFYGGYVITGILVGYILLKEENLSLKRLAVKVLALMLAFSLANTVIYLIPNIISIFESFIYLFTEEYFENGYYRIFEILSSILSLAKTVLFVLLTFFALIGKEFKLPVLDKLLDKYMA